MLTLVSGIWAAPNLCALGCFTPTLARIQTKIYVYFLLWRQHMLSADWKRALVLGSVIGQ